MAARRVLITLGFPPSPGGMQDFLYQRCLAADPSTLLVIAPQSPGWAAFDAGQSFAVRRWHPALARVPGLRRVEQIVKPLWLAFSVYRREGICGVECGQALPFGLIGRLFQVRAHIPYLVWAFGRDILKPGRSRLWRPVLRLVLRHADTVVAVSAWTGAQAVEAGARPDRTVVLRPGVNRRRYSPAPEVEEVARRFGLIGRRVILTVARLVPRKGIDTVLRALPGIVSVVPGCVYVVAGDGPDRPRLERLTARLGLSGHVVFTGAVPDGTLAGLYAACDVFVMVSRTELASGEVEGFGLVYLEAGLYGKPVVAGCEGGAGEAVLDGVTGLLVPPGSVAETAAAILRLLVDGDLARRLGEAGRRHALEEPDWEVLREIGFGDGIHS